MQSVDEFLSQRAPQSNLQSVDDFLSNRSHSGMQTVDQFLSNKPILPVSAPVTQTFGTYNPIEPTADHRAGDTNFATDQNVPVSLPRGQWNIVSAHNGLPPIGYPGNYSDNEGYGNDVVAQNAATGEKLRLLHLANTSVQPGQTVPGNTVVGETGSSGNATGSNLGVEYYDERGNIGDVLSSPYAQYLQTK